ncbi:hypothetical protein INT45_013249 [Circinella minor]|uniref:Uncharacterized protein n=1 Tax=Circinella minor TaxID=1195481 RepID=A0A8H7S4E5_9FUNG|nr:hypothetical protein INT45_013249 [Circinella minor]
MVVGQASCLVLGYKPSDENHKKAKEHLQESSLVAFYFCGQDPIRTAAIGSGVLEQDPYTFLTYPPTPTHQPHYKTMAILKTLVGAPILVTSTTISKAPRNRKRKHEGSIIPYCKERYKMMTNILPSLNRHCFEVQLQDRVGQSQLWGPLTSLRTNNQKIYGQYLWVHPKYMWKTLVETNDSRLVYWEHVYANPQIVNIGYARKSATKKTDVTRRHLFQLMVDKLHFQLKCPEVYVSPCCNANVQISNRDSPSFTEICTTRHSNSMAKSSNYLTKVIKLPSTHPSLKRSDEGLEELTNDFLGYFQLVNIIPSEFWLIF